MCDVSICVSAAQCFKRFNEEARMSAAYGDSDYTKLANLQADGGHEREDGHSSESHLVRWLRQSTEALAQEASLGGHADDTERQERHEASARRTAVRTIERGANYDSFVTIVCTALDSSQLKRALLYSLQRLLGAACQRVGDEQPNLQARCAGAVGEGEEAAAGVGEGKGGGGGISVPGTPSHR